MENIKSLSPLLNQVCLKKLGIYCSERISNDLHPLLEVVDFLISDYGEDLLKKNYPNYDETKNKIKKLRKLIAKSKMFYDLIEDKTFKKKFQDLDGFQAFLNNQFNRSISKIPLIQLDLYKLFVFLVKRSSIQHQTIRSDMFKILEYRDNIRVGVKRDEIKPKEPIQ